MKKIDLPPVWLAAFLVVAWLQSSYYPVLSFGGAWADFLGGLLVGGGLLLLLLAVRELYKQRTTIHPHGESSALVQSGIYRRSRNPIYLGDVLILAGLILRWDAVLSLPLIPIFFWVIERRFIIPEENRLRRTFHMTYAKFERRTRRWL